MGFRMLILAGGIALSAVLSACEGPKLSSKTAEPAGSKTLTAGLVGLDEAELEALFIEGVSKRIVGDIEAAAAIFSQILADDPTNDPAAFELARIFFDAGNLIDALPLARMAAEEDDSNQFYLRLYADLLAVTGQFDEGEEVFARIAEVVTNDPEPLFQLAYVRQQIEDYAGALEAYEEIEERYGAESSLLLEKHRIYVLDGKLGEAAAELEKVVAMEPGNPEYWNMLSRIYETDGKSDKANEIYDRLIEAGKTQSALQLQVAIIHRSRKEYPEYQTKVREAFSSGRVGIDSKIAFLLPFIDSAGTGYSSNDLILDLVDRLADAHPNDPKSWAMRGDFLYYSNLKKEARASYLESIALEHGVFDVWRQAFNIDLETNANDSLAAVTDRALGYFPNQPAIFYFNGYANYQIDRYEKAVKSLKTAAPMSRGNKQLLADIYSLLGDSYHALQDHENSDEAYDRSLEIDPDNAFVLNNYSYYLSLRGDRLEDAATMSAKANELNAGSSSFQDTYAWVLYKLGRYTEAKIWLEKALGNGGEESATLQDHYGDILFQLGEVDAAVEAWTKAKELGMDSVVINRKITDRKLYD